MTAASASHGIAFDSSSFTRQPPTALLMLAQPDPLRFGISRMAGLIMESMGMPAEVFIDARSVNLVAAGMDYGIDSRAPGLLP